jgi:hypothetical protein
MKINFNNILETVMAEETFDYKKSYLDFEKEQEAKNKVNPIDKKKEKVSLSQDQTEKLIKELTTSIKGLSPNSIQDLKNFVNTLKKRDLYSDNEQLDNDDDEDDEDKTTSKPKPKPKSKPRTQPKKEDTSILGKVKGFVKGMVPTQGSLVAKSEDDLAMKIKEFKKQYPTAYVAKPTKIKNQYVANYQYFGEGKNKQSNVKKTMSKLK